MARTAVTIMAKIHLSSRGQDRGRMVARVLPVPLTKNTGERQKADRLTANVPISRFPEPSAAESEESRDVFFVSFPLLLSPCVRHSRQDYLILALIAERTKRE